MLEKLPSTVGKKTGGGWLVAPSGRSVCRASDFWSPAMSEVNTATRWSYSKVQHLRRTRTFRIREFDWDLGQ